ncbi:uncharacterized protein YaaW (UPF0174 family) [Bisgaardia hudsonensis]|uniref:Uncharacterized protein YaaW (UPF0174 family) n=1 Tax=Bisgaardia hudsonensis TaxID=109472 RepID=A0A4R2N0M4_9PAST|nr:DUF3944 domain-containing protein [Bisgaardia hudsonensis]QLB13516.1 hypothetical protein A6A11_07805 [Bisgaardia hudsonensis]TCP12931.1 uncharacterized protein YaaW (UPF0174 family) [Bisgaardia hudsonensis]
MAYRYDPDLEFLAKCSDDDLKDLVDCLIYDKDGKQRYTEELSNSKGYIRYNPEHSKYWKDIAAEIQCFGANSLVTIFRGGEGVLYKEVLQDVCDQLKVNYNKNSKVERIEQGLMQKILETALEEMDAKELQKLAISLGIKNTEGLTPEALFASFQTIFRLGGFKSYQLTVTIVNAILKAILGRGLTIAGNAALTKIMSILTGPIGWAITGLWTAVDIAGPAYRVTIPSVMHIAVLRKKCC